MIHLFYRKAHCITKKLLLVSYNNKGGTRIKHVANHYTGNTTERVVADS